MVDDLRTHVDAEQSEREARLERRVRLLSKVRTRREDQRGSGEWVPGGEGREKKGRTLHARRLSVLCV